MCLPGFSSIFSPALDPDFFIWFSWISVSLVSLSFSSFLTEVLSYPPTTLFRPYYLSLGLFPQAPGLSLQIQHPLPPAPTHTHLSWTCFQLKFPERKLVSVGVSAVRCHLQLHGTAPTSFFFSQSYSSESCMLFSIPAWSLPASVLLYLLCPSHVSIL